MDASSSTMRAASLVRPGYFELVEVPLPQPRSGQVRVRLQGSGVCASNIPAFEGREWFSYPMEPGGLGHEGWGVVDAVGRDVEGVVPGDHVATLSFHAYADYDLAEAGQVVLLPPLLHGQPFPGEALGCAMNIFRRAQIHAGQTVVILGIGFLGAALVQLAAHQGARVIAISRSPSSLKLALRCGAWRALPMDDHRRIVRYGRDSGNIRRNTAK